MKPRYKVGMRNIKTAVAVGICLLTFQLIGLESSYMGLDKDINGIQAALAATICMKSSLQNTVRTGIDRTIGTVIGSMMGVLFLLLIGSIPSYLFVLLITAGVVIIIYLCNVLKLQASVPISIVVYLIILIVQHEVSPFAYGLIRLAETVFGIFVAYMVNRFLDVRRFKRPGKTGAEQTPPHPADIRAFSNEDKDIVMQIWLRTNIDAHSFLDESIWHQRYEAARNSLSASNTRVYDDGQVRGFIRITDDVTISALHVDANAQHSGIGTRLLDHAKATRSCLNILVYKNNESAVKFLLNRGFVISEEIKRENRMEYLMEWSAKNSTAACSSNPLAQTGI